jgi:hypothetical protein
MAIRCDFRAINGEAKPCETKPCETKPCETKPCAGAALILGGLLLLIAP